MLRTYFSDWCRSALLGTGAAVWSLVVVLVFLALLAGCASTGPTREWTAVVFQVREAGTERPIAGATVQFRDRLWLTDASGNVGPHTDEAAFYWVPVGQYGYAVRHSEFENLEHQILQVAPGENIVRVALSRKTPRGPPETNRPLIGRLIVRDKLVHDATGPRRIQGASAFPLLRILRDDPDLAIRVLDEAAKANHQIVRVFAQVGIWHPFWNDREVAAIDTPKWRYTGNVHRGEQIGLVKAWPNYDSLFVRLLDLARERRLRLDVTFGDMQPFDEATEIGLHRRLARLVARNGHQHTIATWQYGNEYWQNSQVGRHEDPPARIGRVLAAVKAELPHVLTAQGSLNSEEPDDLFRSSRYGDVAALHGLRSPFQRAMERRHAVIWWAGNWRFFHKPVWRSEPSGPNGRLNEVTAGTTQDPAQILAIHAMHQITGQPSIYFNGPAVRMLPNDTPVWETWGFRELNPILDKHLSEDVATWRPETGPHEGMMYMTSGRRFATVFIPGWNPSPPRAIARWTVVGPSGEQTGTNNLPAMTAPRLVVGEFR